jgi:hypothetical protein
MQIVMNDLVLPYHSDFTRICAPTNPKLISLDSINQALAEATVCLHSSYKVQLLFLYIPAG